MITHLHVHSYCSFLEGLTAPADLARAASAQGMHALALTDHLGLSGTLPFYRACRAEGIRPIIGLEVDLLLPYRLSVESAAETTGSLVLLALDETGWKNLCRISSHLLTRSGEAALHLSLDALSSRAEGLICLTGGCRGAPDRLLEQPDGEEQALRLLNQLGDIFPGRLYAELHKQAAGEPAGDERLLTLARRAGVPPAAAHSIYYLSPEQESQQRTAAAIREIVPLDRLPRSAAAPPGAYFLSAAEMERRFSGCPEALAAAAEIASRCDLTFDFTTRRYPVLDLPAGESPEAALRRMAEEGARKLYGKPSQTVTARLESELAVINARGYAPIFLIASEMIAFSRASGIPTASRGSASSSLVAHCIGITTPDPLELDLFFERFLNPERTTPPDIDTDFCSRRRDEVIQHLFDICGEDRVAMVGTINTFRRRSALSEVAKAHGLKPPEIRTLVNGLGYRRFHPGGQQEEASPYAELIARFGGTPRYGPLFAQAAALIGLPHHLSVHAGGVVIAPGPLVECVPVARSGGKGTIITQFDHADVEKMGLVKLDLLGIRGLTVLGDVASSIHSWRRKEFRAPLDVLERVPAEDAETAALVAGGRTIGCFQIESPGMRATLRDIQAASIPDLIAALALFRPGPLKGGLRDAFVRRHNRREAVSHIHPVLAPLLADTYGVILYQEQVLRIAHGLAGFTLAEADLLRRAMSHFDPGRQMIALQEKFGRGAAEKGVPADTAARIWEMMAAFAGYGFPKAHAASYAAVAWRSAWCKAHYPAEFIAAVLANWGGYYPQSVYLNEARRMGLAARPPHINHSAKQFSVAYPGGSPLLFMGLDQVRDLTHRTQERTLRLRPFNSLADFIARAEPRPQEVINLIEVGALDGLGAIPDLLRELAGGRTRPGQLSLFAESERPSIDWTPEQKNAAQQRLLGTSLEAHPLELAAPLMRAAGAITTVEAAARVGETVRVAGMRQAFHRSPTSQNADMGFLTLEDLEGMLEVVLFSGAFQRARGALSRASMPLLVEGIVERDAETGEPFLRGETITLLR